MDEMEKKDDAAEGSDAAEGEARPKRKRRELLSRHLDPRPEARMRDPEVKSNFNRPLSAAMRAKLTPGLNVDDLDIDTLEGLAAAERTVILHACEHLGVPVLWPREMIACLRDRAEQVKAASARAAGLPWEMPPPSGRRR